MDLHEIRECYRHAYGLRGRWREEAKKAYEFVAGEQWAPEDRQVMEDQMRPVVTFNRIAPIVDAIVGHEATNRQAVKYLPRQLGATEVNEVLSEAADWVRDECGADGEEADAFQDCVITGEGWTDTRVSYETDLDGQILIERVDPMEMLPDPAATRKNYADAKWVCRTRKMPRSRALEIWPEGDFAGVSREEGSVNPVEVIPAAFYHLNSGAGGREYSEDLVLVHDFQWWALEKVYRLDARQLPPALIQIMMAEDLGLKPGETGLITLTTAQYDVLRGILGTIKPVEQKRRRYYRTFWSGEHELERKLTPTGEDFSYHAITGKRDNHRRQWYGIVRGIMDPQQWGNKFMSLALETLATSGKGGVLAETDAFQNLRQAEQDWADPSRIIYMQPGALGAGKVQPRPVSQTPPQMQQLMMYANQSLNDVAGVNPAVLGFSQELNTSGVLENARRSAGLSMLSYLFEALRRYRIAQGRCLMKMIRQYIPQGRLVKIVRPEGEQFVPLVYDPSIERYDVIVDEAPTAPNVKERTWDSFIALAPHLPPNFLTPQVLQPLLEYSPFPAALVSEWKKAVSPQQPPPPNPLEQVELAQKQADVRATQADAAYKEAQVKHLETSAQTELQAAQIKGQAEQAQAEAELESARAKAAQAQVALHADAIRGAAQVAGEQAKTVSAAARAHADILRSIGG